MDQQITILMYKKKKKKKELKLEKKLTKFKIKGRQAMLKRSKVVASEKK